MSLFEKEIKHYYNTGLKRFRKLYGVDYVTNFEDNEGEAIFYSRDVNKGTYSDDGNCIYLLSLETDNWAKVAERICNRYGCELDVDREELVAKEDYILVQTMLAIYAWIEFKDWLYYDQIEEKHGIMHDKGE
ncbi:hypothetical protein [Limosilactobacillus mucosae]|uniref:hypothetical protein n=1 Tax=Limosilactobacillus mucosae TaxID=97478 RepID=UPI0022E5D3E0|nr:hypothetical protein [Limosilactobacillus mucosae]